MPDDDLGLPTAQRLGECADFVGHLADGRDVDEHVEERVGPVGFDDLVEAADR